MPDIYPDEKLALVEVGKTAGDVTELGVVDKTTKDATGPGATEPDAMATDLNDTDHNVTDANAPTAQPNPVPAETLHVASVSEPPTKRIKPGQLKDPSKIYASSNPMDEDSPNDGKKPKAMPARKKVDKITKDATGPDAADPDEDSSADGKKPKAVSAGKKTFAMLAKERKFQSALATLLAEDVESGWTPVMFCESFEKISTAGVIAGNANCIAIVGNPEGEADVRMPITSEGKSLFCCFVLVVM